VSDRCVREVRLHLLAAAQRVAGRRCVEKFAVRLLDMIDDAVLWLARRVADCRIFGGIEYVCEHPDKEQCRKYSVSMRGGPERGGWMSDCPCACHERRQRQQIGDLG
jgi:hypothetical protein